MNIVPVTLAPLTGEVLPTGAGVRVIGKTHPLNGGEIERYLDAGTTIGEMLEETRSDRPDFLDRNQMIVHIDGDPIETCNWHRIRAKPGTTVTFVPRLQGGAIWRTVLAVMVVAATVFAAPRVACHWPCGSRAGHMGDGRWCSYWRGYCPGRQNGMRCVVPRNATWWCRRDGNQCHQTTASRVGEDA